jgi:hypothetical protein
LVRKEAKLTIIFLKETGGAGPLLINILKEKRKGLQKHVDRTTGQKEKEAGKLQGV